jgi:hypothetical protein
MSDTQANRQSRHSAHWSRRILWTAGGLAVVLILLYWFTTSAAFLRGFVLPKASKALNASITFDDATLRPFSQVILRGVGVRTGPGEPLLTAREVSAKYDLMAILRGDINVHEVVLDTPAVSLIQNPDGTSNLDPILAATKAAKPAAPAKPSKPPRLNVRSATVNHASLSIKKTGANGTRIVADISALDITATNLRNGQSASLALSANLNLLTTTGTNTDELHATLQGRFRADLAADMALEAVRGESELAITNAKGTFGEAAGVSAKLVTDLTLDNIKQLALNFSKDGAPLGALSVTGPFSLARQQGNLTLDISGIDKRVLNLAGAAMGIDFGPTILRASNQVGWTGGGKLITVQGRLVGEHLSLTQKGQTTPPLDLQARYDMTIDQNAKTALVQTFTLDGTQDQGPLLTCKLTKPMKLDWGKTAGAVDESALNLTVTNLNLADWRSFAGSYANAGRLSLNLQLLSQQAGKKLTINLDSHVAGLSAGFGTNRLDQTDLALRVRGEISDFTRVALDDFGLQLGQHGQQLAAIQGRGAYDVTKRNADLQTTIAAALPGLTTLLSLPELKLSAGTVRFTGRITQNNEEPNLPGPLRLGQDVSGDLQLTGISGQYADYRFNRLDTAVNLDLTFRNHSAEIRKLAGTVSQGGQAGGRFDLTGNYQIANQAGRLALKLTDLNQNTLQSFAARALADKVLTSIAVGADLAVSYDAKGESAVKGALQVANLVITDPKGRLPNIPFSADVRLDGSLKNNVADLHRLAGAIRQGQQPAGSFEAKGSYNLKEQAGQLVLNLTNLNQNGLRPFLAPALGDKTLNSVSINARASARYNPKADSSVQADLEVTNLVVNDPSGKLRSTPLAASLKLDGAMAKQALDFRRLQLNLSPTTRATNQLQLTGRVDLSASNAITGNLKLAAHSLDLTPYYDLLAGRQESEPKPIAPAKPGPTITSAPLTKPAPEPPPVNLPFRQFTVGAGVGRLFLRELAFTNLTISARINGGQLDLDPFQFTLNGAPVNARAHIDLGVPGYRYDAVITADRVPLEPVVNSFVPDKRGQLTGLIVANAQVKGVGTTGASLQKFAEGQFNFSLTNANIQVLKSQTRVLFIPINLGILATVLGVPEITQSPVTAMNARLSLGNGRITIQQADVLSEAFRADLGGVIPIREVLTNSPLDLPVEVSLRRTLADKARLTPANTPTNVAFVKLPAFARVAGTLGNPETKTDKLVIAGLIAQFGAGFLKGKTGGVVQEIGNLLTGQTAASPSAQTNRPPQPRTNAPASNVIQVNPLNLLQDLLQKKE